TPTLNLGCIHGGDNPNRICGRCALEFDLRPLPGMDPDALRAAIAQRLAVVAERHRVEIDYQPLFPGVAPLDTPASAEIVRACEQLTGYSAGSVAFATEGPYLNQLGLQTVILGPGDIAPAHQPDEYLARERSEPTVRVLRDPGARLWMEHPLSPAHYPPPFEPACGSAQRLRFPWHRLLPLPWRERVGERGMGLARPSETAAHQNCATCASAGSPPGCA